MELWVTDPTPADMLGLTFLDASGVGIADLTGLEYALNLRTFECIHSQLTSLAPLAGLVNLESLAFNENNISDLSPLAGLTNLRSLILHDNEISDISPLAGLSKLEMLDLHANQISRRLGSIRLDQSGDSHPGRQPDQRYLASFRAQRPSNPAAGHQ